MIIRSIWIKAAYVACHSNISPVCMYHKPIQTTRYHTMCMKRNIVILTHFYSYTVQNGRESKSNIEAKGLC